MTAEQPKNRPSTDRGVQPPLPQDSAPSARLVVGDRDASEMVVCGTCGQVRGPWHYAHECLRHVTLVQSCRCTREKEPLWPRFDFNTSVELCWCCAAEAVSSGSRWSLVLCPDCKARAIALMRGVGRFVVPIGRHSLMNRVSLSVSGPRPSTEVVAQFAARLQRFSGGLTVLYEWSQRQALVNEAAIGAKDAPAIPLPDYLSAVAALPVHKAAVFGELCREIGVEPAHDDAGGRRADYGEREAAR
jgi:hypothetical protein